MDPDPTDPKVQRDGEQQDNSSYLMMLNNITNDLDALLSEFCNLSYADPQPAPPIRNTRMRTTCKKPMQIENCSAFGGSSTSGTLTSTDSNHSNKGVRSGTLTSTDSNSSVTKPRSTSVHSSHLDVFGLSSRPLEIPSYPEKQSCNSLSTSSSDLRQISCLERVTKTHPIWFLPEVGRTGAVHLLKDKDIGIFIVRKSSHDHIMALSAQFPCQGGAANVDHYLIEPTEYGLHLQGSKRVFNAIPNLIAYYCDYKEDLPHRLVLPPAIRNSKTSQELNGLSLLGQAFWTSAKYESTSRSSSRSNLSEQSSMMNKSRSEPISIAQKATGVITASQPETTMHNTAPKHSVIDFSSYLIPSSNEGTDDLSHGTNSLSVANCVHSKCSVSESVKHCDHMTSHVTQSKYHIQSEECSHSKMVLHNFQKDVDLNDSIDNDSRISDLYAKPKKNKSNLYSTTHLGLLDIPENLYFTSNLSDKLSDYEDIWKNSNSLPNNGSVQADIVSRLHPDLLHASKPNGEPTNGLTGNGASSTVIGNSVATDWQSDSSSVVEPQFISPSRASRELPATEDIHVAEQAVSSREKSVFDTFMSEASENVVHHVVMDNCQSAATDINSTIATSASLHNTFATYDLEVLQKELSQSNLGFDAIPESESDIDTDSCHSNSYHSDDADADTEEGSFFQKNSSVQTQTSPVIKSKPPPLQMAAQGSRKFASNPSLSTIKSPVYSEPFDAINTVIENQKEAASKLPKKLRRRSAPVVGLAKRRLGTIQCPRLARISSANNDDLSPAGHEGSKSNDVIDEAFMFLHSLGDVHESPEHVYEHAWVGGGNKEVLKRLSPTAPQAPVSPLVDKSRKVKPTPAPRKPGSVCRPGQQGENYVFSRKSKHEVANRIEKARSKQLEKSPLANVEPAPSVNHHVRDQLQVMEDFENSQVPSSLAVNKFPVDSTKTSEELHRASLYESSTAEDIISSWNPELTLRPMKPFPLFLQASAMSEYDNLNSQSYRAPSIASAGTVFCKPWEASTFGIILNSPAFPISKSESPAEPPPALPPQMDMHERIKAWQESSQNYISVAMDIEDNKPDLIPDETSVVTKTITGEQSISEVRLSTDGHTSQSDKTLVNEKVASHSKQQSSKSNEENIPLFGADFREKVMPILVNPRLLHQTKNRNPDCKIHGYILRLSKDRGTTFGSTIENFIQCTVESQETNPFVVTRNIRQFMNGIKNYLVKHGEGELEDLIERERNKLGADEILNIDAILENTLHVCVIQPLKQNIYQLFVNEYTRNGNLKLLSSNIKYARTKSPEEIGIRNGVKPPDSATLEVIKQYLTRMQRTYSPLNKLENLLGATSTIYKFVAGKQTRNGSASFGADDFLPMLIYVLVHCGMVAVEIEADYMWGLLHPSLLTGEGGYYLTTLSSAVLVLKNFRDMQETKSSKQEGKIPSISDMQGFLKIAIPDELRNTIVWKTLPVRPNMTTKDICSMIAHNFKITNPQDYSLYTLEKGEECKLNDHECPQLLKADRLAHKMECFFAYKRCAANIAWPKSLLHT